MDEIRALFDEHKRTEEQFLKKRAEDEEQQSKQLEDIRTKDAND
jgi:hypothetical protein